MVFERTAPNGVVSKRGKRLHVYMMMANYLNLSFKSPSSIKASTVGPIEKAVVTVADPFGIHTILTNKASLTE